MEVLSVIQEILSIFGGLLRFAGFLLIGYGIARFTLNSYKEAAWQVQIALVIGFFGLLAAITHYASAGSAGAFALGGGAAFFLSDKSQKENGEKIEEKKDKKKKS